MRRRYAASLCDVAMRRFGPRKQFQWMASFAGIGSHGKHDFVVFGKHSTRKSWLAGTGHFVPTPV